MAQTLRIELIAPAAQLVKDLRQVASAMNQVASANSKIGGGSRPSVLGGNGPFTRLYALNNQLGNPNSMSLAQAQHMNMQLAQQRAQQQANRAMGIGPSFGQRLSTFARSTRFGGNVSPLVGRTYDLLGGGQGGSASAGIGIALAAIVGLAMAAKHARDSLVSLAGINNFAGGSVGSASMASRLGSTVGMSGSQVAQTARAVMESIASGGPATTYANAYGVRAVPGLGDPSNKIDRLIQLAKGIANDPSEEHARRAAQSLGVEEFLNLRNLSPETRNKVFKSMKNGPNKEDVKAAAEFNAQVGLIGDSFQRIATKIGTPILRIAAAGLEKIADALDWIAQNADVVRNAVLGPILQIVELLTGRKADTSGNNQKSSIDKNTDALNRNTDAINVVAGTYGGGAKARAAGLKAWQSKEFQDRYMKSQAAAMGAFAF